MSHLLSRLVDRAMGITPKIEPVHTPLFGSEPTANNNTGGRRPTDDRQRAPTTQMQRSRFHSERQFDSVLQSTADAIEPRRSLESTIEPLAKTRVDTTPVPGDAAPARPSANDDRRSGVKTHTSSKIEPANNEGIESAQAISPVEVNLQDNPQKLGSTNSEFTRDEPKLNSAAAFSEQLAMSPSKMPAANAAALKPRSSTEPTFSAQTAINSFRQEQKKSRIERPTVKVNIGRVDVRTVTSTPAPASPRRKKAQPSLTLDEYLKQRAGSGR